MAQTETVPTLNGEQLTDLDAAERALSYLRDGYNDGNLNRTVGIDGHEVLVVVSRSATFQHFGRFREAPDLRLQSPRAVEDDGRKALKVEIVEDK